MSGATPPSNGQSPDRPSRTPASPLSVPRTGPRFSGRVRAGFLTVALVGGVVFTGGWALPNLGGAMFVHVRAVVTPIASTTGPSLVVAGAPSVQASSVALTVEVQNTYPLAVVLGSDPIAYTAAVYARGTTGALTKVWQTGVGDPTSEEGSDSPVGGGSSKGAVVVQPGTHRHQLAGGLGAYRLIGSTGAALPAGVYYVRVWAYGIGSPLVPLFIDTGADPLGMPPPPAS